MANPTTSSIALEVSVADQRMVLLENGLATREYVISTALNGIGCEEGSNCTPTGRFQIAEMHGAEAPWGTIFKGRVPVGQWAEGDESEEDLVLTRILWLEGLDPENANTKDRYIYIHGTNQESQLGTPVSHGCVRMRNAEVIELFDLVSVGTPVRIV